MIFEGEEGKSRLLTSCFNINNSFHPLFRVVLVFFHKLIDLKMAGLNTIQKVFFIIVETIFLISSYALFRIIRIK